MESSSSYAASEEDVSCDQSEPLHGHRAAGVLRHNRESDQHTMNPAVILPAPLTEQPVKCEYCGEKARPSLDLTWMQEPETVLLFCCGRWQRLCETLLKQRHGADGKCDPRTSPGDKPDFRGKEMKDHKFITEPLSGQGGQSDLRIYERFSIQQPAAETSAPTSKGFRFRLSCASGKGFSSCSTTENNMDIKEEVLVPLCEQKPLQFGICHHQTVSELFQKSYSDGRTCLTAFPDGSAQLFYPSGLLALVVVVTERHGRVCVVYDDCDASNPRLRAVFQSDGRATCYHSNGNIWLALNPSGGQCLDEAGFRVRSWSWSRPGLTPTPLHPVFLSLNKTVGVRVLGRERVFVSFLAKSQQVKFSVGSCCVQEKAAPGPSVLKEDVLVLAARLRIHLILKRLHQSPLKASHPRLPKTSRVPGLRLAAQRLVEVSADVTMSESERVFIHECLQDLM